MLEARWILAGGETTGKRIVIAFVPRQGNGIEVRMGAQWFDELQFVEVYDI